MSRAATPRHPWPDARPLGRVAVVGAGIAGCRLRELAEAGFEVDVLDEGASFRPAAIPGRCFSRCPTWVAARWATGPPVLCVDLSLGRRRGLPWDDLRVARYGDKRAHADRLRTGLVALPSKIRLPSRTPVRGDPWPHHRGDGARRLVSQAAGPSRHPGAHPQPRDASDARWMLGVAGPFDTVVLANSFAARALVPALDLHPVRGQFVFLPATRDGFQNRALCGRLPASRAWWTASSRRYLPPG